MRAARTILHPGLEAFAVSIVGDPHLLEQDDMRYALSGQPGHSALAEFVSARQVDQHVQQRLRGPGSFLCRQPATRQVEREPARECRSGRQTPMRSRPGRSPVTVGSGRTRPGSSSRGATAFSIPQSRASRRTRDQHPADRRFLKCAVARLRLIRRYRPCSAGSLRAFFDIGTMRPSNG